MLSNINTCPFCIAEARRDLPKKLKEVGYTVQFRNRKLANGTKLYLTIKTEHTGVWKDLKFLEAIIKSKFPEAYMTSGSVHEATFATTPT